LVYDPRESGLIDSSRWFTKSKVTERLYHGRPRQGQVDTTIVNGVIVYENNQIVAPAGVGRFVQPQRK
jgi:dihydroorotase-like cyclic amidohydrolase